MASGHTETFRTHANYLRAFAMLCDAPYASGSWNPFGGTLDAVLGRLGPHVAASPSMAPPINAAPDPVQAHTSLHNAWGTELLLALGGRVATATADDLVHLINNWAVVQAYYIGYHATQALIVTRGQPRPANHPSTQAQFAALWADRPLNLPPWSLAACDGGWRNANAAIDDSLNSWSTCDPLSCWNLAAKALRTTRGERVADAEKRRREDLRRERRKTWQAEERERLAKGRKPRTEPPTLSALPRLGAADKARVGARVRSFTLLDYLYRLRVKTNYEDAGMFIEGPEDIYASKQVHQDLVQIAGCTLLAHELHVGAIIGKTTFMGWVDGWIAKNGAGAAIGLQLRRDILATHVP